MPLKPILITFVSILLLNISDVKAQTDTSKLTPSHLAAAEKLIATTGMTDLRFSTMRNEMVSSMGETIHIPEKNKAKFTAKMSVFMDKYLPIDAFKDRFVKIYAAAFTEDELNQLIKFYDSPLGKKVISKLPALMQNGMVMEQQALKDHYSEIESIVSESLQE